MKRVIKVIFGLYLGIFCFACHEPIPTVDETEQLWKDCKLENLLPLEVFKLAYQGYQKLDTVREKDILAIIDYSKPSTEKRFFVINPQNKTLLYSTLVAHGKNSGENLANSFSNLPNSLQSSIGFFITGETYLGDNGYSMRIDGLEKGINDMARARDIVIHGAKYVNEEYLIKNGRIGRSWGCPALPETLSKEIIDTIAFGCCLFVYGDDEFYRENSTFTK